MKINNNGHIVLVGADDAFSFDLFRERLAVSINQVDITVAALAELADLSVHTIYRIIHRECQGLHVKTLAKLAKALDLSANYLIGRVGPTTKSEKIVEKEVRENLKLAVVDRPALKAPKGFRQAKFAETVQESVVHTSLDAVESRLSQMLAKLEKLEKHAHEVGVL